MPHFASPHLAMPGLGQGSGPGVWARDVQDIKKILLIVLIPGPDLVKRAAATDIRHLMINR